MLIYIKIVKTINYIKNCFNLFTNYNNLVYTVIYDLLIWGCTLPFAVLLIMTAHSLWNREDSNMLTILLRASASLKLTIIRFFTKTLKSSRIVLAEE